ncbi:MAG: ABC transporter substrate-binding protein [Alphaproteobacteria bacterium]|nr:ABC transporter substrate-binding protein [Alphaproteobacteria bacterium]NCQ87553.1 ABC transporter substrate-binding protein [Alphaproteobacteria bacterium]NCT06421.1 ABC transporter substrate-binding protein [Alphaproteobacteria bacterium]
MRFLTLLLLLTFSAPAMAELPMVNISKSITMHGTAKYDDNFTHLDYVNPDAPKGGELKLSAIGTFDSLNPFIIKGTPAAGMTFLGQSFVYDSLMEQSLDEPFSMYGLLAETIELPESRQWVAFNINPLAKWADGLPVTAHDVVWTFNTVLENGQPFFKAYYGDVTKVEATSDSRVKFTFKHGDNAELPLIIAQMSILPKHYWTAQGRNFSATSLDAPLGSGPYAVSKVEAGRTIDYTRRADYWGKDLPINKGRFNFDKISYDYYKDSNVALEAFFANEFDFQLENTAKLWATAYDAPAVQSGQIIKEEIAHERPQGMQGFLYNIRKPVFQDIEVRKALAYAFDFDWSNKQFAYDSYTRTDSFFENSELASTDGLPEGRVLEILESYRDQLPADVFTTRYTPPKTDGSGRNRANMKKATDILDAAGYKLGEDGIRVHETTGQRLQFEIIDSNPLFERWVLPFIGNLKKIGVEANFRVLDPAQYQNRMNDFDYDMTIGSMGQSSSPGNEQRDYWSSVKADTPGSRNTIGVKDPVVDDLIEKLIQAPSRAELVALTQALDRVLLSGYYVIPQWHIDHFRVAYWKKLGRPAELSGLTPAVTDTWWVKSE